MNRLRFFLRTAWVNLMHGGQRTVVALLCVAFGTMSLVAMMLLSNAIERMLVKSPRDLFGGDISAGRSVEDVILPEHRAGLEELRAQGILGEYTLAAYSSTLTYRLPKSGELHFAAAGIGIDPAVYPPAGALTIESPGGAGLPTLLQEPGDVVVTRDIALEHDIQPGDSLIISDLGAGTAVTVNVRGIVIDTPNHQGSKMYYNLATAERLASGSPSLNTLLALADNPLLAQHHLEKTGWRAFLAPEIAKNEESVQQFFAFMLNGAGVLGLLVSGIGIANTMQVLLRRRRREIAVWKTLGYQSGDLLLMFALEAAMLGLFGSLLGAVAGVALSAGLVDLFSRTSTLLVIWSVDPRPALLAVFVSIATTVVFALWAIVVSSRVPPVSLLRGESTAAASLPWFQAVGLAFLLAVPFTAVISLVMGSILKALGVLAVALLGLTVLGAALVWLLRLFVRLLPLRAAPLLNMARGNLLRRGFSPGYAMTALFVGVVALAAAGVVTYNAGRVINAVAPAMAGNNLIVLSDAQTAAQVRERIAAHSPESLSTGYQTRVRSIRVLDIPGESLTPLLMARETAEDYAIAGAEWGSRPDGVYVSSLAPLPEDSTLEVTLWDGSVHSLPVVGTYVVDFERMFQPELGVLLPVELSQSISPPDLAYISARIPPANLSSATQSLGIQLPQATVINLVAYAARFTSQYRNLFIFAVSMASLALLAGAMLMANSVSLAMLDRRYEIGVLKAMGYARRHVLLTLVVEYALIAILACGVGLLLVRVFLWLVSLQNPLAAAFLVMTPFMAGLVMISALGLTALTVLAVTWKPTRVSPLVVLNDRE